MPEQRDILFLPISGPRGASSRYRVLQFLPAIEAAGLSYDIHLPSPPGSGIQRVLTAFQEKRLIARKAQEAQSVFIQKRLLPANQVESLAARCPLLFDFDDAIFTSPAGNRSRVAERRVEQRLGGVLSAARVVIAGNRYLCDYAGQFSKHVIHLPTVVDTSRYPAKQHLEIPELVIGWIGHSVNHPYLFSMADVMLRLSSCFRIRLLVVSDRDLSIPGVQVENRRWSEATEVRDILAMDIGIMPMPDDPWSRGKCGLKAIQYMAAGIPVVCAAVGANNDIVRHGIDGYCASTLGQWEEYLAGLCRDIHLRRQMGMSARRRVQENYSLDSRAPTLIAALTGLGVK